MNLSFGIVFLWISIACLYVAFQQGTAVTPWQVIQEIVSGATGQGGPAAATGDDQTTSNNSDTADEDAALAANTAVGEDFEQ